MSYFKKLWKENQVLASKILTSDELKDINLPTVADPFAGPVSYAARPGQVIHITLRVYGTFDELNGLSNADFIAGTGFGVSAHACNDSNNINLNEDCLTLDSEKILIDKSSPVILAIERT